MDNLGNILLKKTGIGFLLMLLLAVVISVTIAQSGEEAYIFVKPKIQQEASAFLPIVFENGAIAEPKDAVISRSFSEGNKTYNFVLNTQVDVLDTSTLDNGLYVTRTNLYAVDTEKGQTKIQTLSNMPNMVITNEVVKLFFENAAKYVYPTIFVIALVIMIAFWYVAILLYTAVMYLPFSKFFNNDFAQTFRVNQLVYLALTAISYFFGTSVKIILTLGLMLAVNYCVNKALAKKS